MPKRTIAYRPWLLARLRDPDVAIAYLRGVLRDSPELFPKALRKVCGGVWAYDLTKSGSRLSFQEEMLPWLWYKDHKMVRRKNTWKQRHEHFAFIGQRTIRIHSFNGSGGCGMPEAGTSFALDSTESKLEICLTANMSAKEYMS